MPIRSSGKLDIIIPVYNKEKYLEKCVNSALSQSYAPDTVILADDGSTDGSASLCDALAARDERIRVIHRENGGLSAARNTALDVAQGACLAFVDGDDFIHPGMYGLMSRTQKETNAEIVISRFRRVPENALPESVSMTSSA